jgi:hypothetical protein
MMNLPKALAARQRELVRALRDVVAPDHNWELEREALAQAGGPRPLAGTHTHHEPELRRYTVRGTVCDAPVTAPFVCDYDTGLNLSDTSENALRAAIAVTAEDFTDVMINGRRRWTGPMG